VEDRHRRAEVASLAQRGDAGERIRRVAVVVGRARGEVLGEGLGEGDQMAALLRPGRQLD
jgi:hypothetical protein